ncbi:PqiA/YebS family transporter subunit [Onishia taeanensis]|uniref:PqiA/YebS family transporter subunit n=1 Tax=Onishia taeanensis TaxID=284577 RepID=UPI003C7E96DD
MGERRNLALIDTLTPDPHLPVQEGPPEAHMSRRRLRACHECDWLVRLPPLHRGQSADCPRCGHTLSTRHYRPAQRSLALAIAALLALIMAISLPFVSFQISGIGNRIVLTQTATSLIGMHQPLVAIGVVLTTIVLPMVYLLSVIWLQIGLLRRTLLPASRDIARALSHLHPWMMADVFIIGALVSLIKIAGMAEVSLGLAFWAFCCFALLLLLTTQSLDADWMWFSLVGEPAAPEGVVTGARASPQGLTGCPTCGLVNRLDADGNGRCRRCGERLHARLPYSLQRTWALLAAATLLYLPANLYPIMITTSLGHTEPSTIIGGVITLWQHGSYPIAAVIFIASILVPVSKLIAMAWLCLRVPRSDDLQGVSRTRLYRITEFVGRWSMVDVFVVAILVALIRAGNLMSIAPGPAALAFGAVVVLTMLSAMAFDPRLIWDPPLPRSGHSDTGHGDDMPPSSSDHKEVAHDL